MKRIRELAGIDGQDLAEWRLEEARLQRLTVSLRDKHPAIGAISSQPTTVYFDPEKETLVYKSGSTWNAAVAYGSGQWRGLKPKFLMKARTKKEAEEIIRAAVGDPDAVDSFLARVEAQILQNTPDKRRASAMALGSLDMVQVRYADARRGR